MVVRKFNNRGGLLTAPRGYLIPLNTVVVILSDSFKCSTVLLATGRQPGKMLETIKKQKIHINSYIKL